MLMIMGVILNRYIQYLNYVIYNICTRILVECVSKDLPMFFEISKWSSYIRIYTREYLSMVSLK